MDRFLTKVRLLRDVLNAVNGRFGEPKLAGLHYNAVARWLQASSQRQRIAPTLWELSKPFEAQAYTEPPLSVLDACAMEGIRDLALNIECEVGMESFLPIVARS